MTMMIMDACVKLANYSVEGHHQVITSTTTATTQQQLQLQHNYNYNNNYYYYYLNYYEANA